MAAAMPQPLVIHLCILRAMFLLFPLFVCMLGGSLWWATLSILVAVWPMRSPDVLHGEPIPPILAASMYALIVKDLTRQLLFFFLFDGWYLLKLYSLLTIVIVFLTMSFHLTGYTEWNATPRLRFVFYNH